MDRVRAWTLDLTSVDRIHQHERVDLTRKTRIEGRIVQDGVLRDPLMIGSVPQFDGYVLLDGTNRLEALRSLDLSWALVQIMDYSAPSSVALRTWCHSTDVPFETMMQLAAGLPDVKVEPIAPLGASDALAAHSTVAVLLSKDRIAAVMRSSEYPHSRAEQLCALVSLYEHRMRRVDCNPDEIEELAQTTCGVDGRTETLVAFPAITRSQVTTMAMRGTLIPAGITRHVILEGRALRVNVPLQMLRGVASVEQARQQLHDHLATLQPRIYREPTVLYDS